MSTLAFDYLPVASAETIHTKVCTAYVWRPAKGVLVSRVEGYFSEDAAALVDAKVRSCVAEDGSVLGIHDWWEASDYATSTRTRLTRMGSDVRPLTEGIHILVQSRILALAVKTTSLVVRNITAYSQREPFERFLSGAVRQRRAAAR